MQIKKLAVFASACCFLVAFLREIPLVSLFNGGATNAAWFSLALLQTDDLTFFAWGTVSETSGVVYGPLSASPVESLLGFFFWVLPVLAGVFGLVGAFPPEDNPSKNAKLLRIAGAFCEVECLIFSLVLFIPDSSIASLLALRLGFYLLTASGILLALAAKSEKVSD